MAGLAAVLRSYPVHRSTQQRPCACLQSRRKASRNQLKRGTRTPSRPSPPCLAPSPLARLWQRCCNMTPVPSCPSKRPASTDLPRCSRAGLSPPACTRRTAAAPGREALPPVPLLPGCQASAKSAGPRRQAPERPLCLAMQRLTASPGMVPLPQLEGKRYASYAARYEGRIVQQMIRNDGGTGQYQELVLPMLGLWNTLLKVCRPGSSRGPAGGQPSNRSRPRTSLQPLAPRGCPAPVGKPPGPPAG